MTEVWKLIPGFEGRYEASSEGRLRGTRPSVNQMPSGAALYSRVNKLGYVDTLLTVEKGVRRRVSVHPLIAAAFIGPRPEGMTVNHKNGDRADNRVSNLEYATAKENVRHAFRTLRKDRAITFFGQQMCLREALDIFGVANLSVEVVRERLNAGVDMLTAISTPARKWVRKAAA